MIRKVIILFSLCCVVLCAFVGYLSYQVTQQSKQAIEASITMTCEAVLASPPTKTSGVILTEFVPLISHLAFLDKDRDNQWDELCVPFFPQKKPDFGLNYSAVLVCFRDVPTRQALDTLLSSGELDLNYWPQRQKLNVAIHSQLAQKHTMMDFTKSPVFFHGYKAANPLLGEGSLYASAGVGLSALLAAFLAMVSPLFMRKSSLDVDFDSDQPPTTNRAGLPVGESISILDQIAASRSAMSE